MAGLQTVGGQVTNTSKHKDLTVPCPAGKRIISGGAYAGSGDRSALLESSGPNEVANAWVASAIRPAGDGFNWSLTVYATCAYVS